MTFAHPLDEIAAETAISDRDPAREGVPSFREKRKPRFHAALESRETQ